jgi:hypothetical protein
MTPKSQSGSVEARVGAVEQSIKNNPLKAMGFGVLAGFVIGGGYRSRLGISILLVMGRAAIREIAISAVSKAMDQHDGRSGKDRKRS